MSELALRRTSTGHAPWTVVEGSDPNFRYLTVGRTIADAVERRLDGAKPVTPTPAALPEPPADGRTVLTALDYRQKLSHKDYRHELDKYQGKLNLLMRHKKLGATVGDRRCSKGWMPPARAAPSAGWSGRWMRGTTA